MWGGCCCDFDMVYHVFPCLYDNNKIIIHKNKKIKK